MSCWIDRAEKRQKIEKKRNKKRTLKYNPCISKPGCVAETGDVRSGLEQSAMQGGEQGNRYQPKGNFPS